MAFDVTLAVFQDEGFAEFVECEPRGEDCEGWNRAGAGSWREVGADVSPAAGGRAAGCGADLWLGRSDDAI